MKGVGRNVVRLHSNTHRTCSFTENGSPLRRQQDGNTGEAEDGGCHIRSPGGVGFIAAPKRSPFVTYRVHASTVMHRRCIVSA